MGLQAESVIWIKMTTASVTESDEHIFQKTVQIQRHLCIVVVVHQ